MQVNADLNVDQTTRDKLTYDKQGVPLKTPTETEELRGRAAAPAARPAPAGNIPQLRRGRGRRRQLELQQRETEDTDFGVDKTVERTKVAPGAVNKLNVALRGRQVRPAADVAALADAVSTAAGIDTERGDTLAVSQVAVRQAGRGAEKPGPADGAARLRSSGSARPRPAALPVLHDAPPAQARGRALGEPTWLREIEEPVSLAALEGGPTHAAPPPCEMPPREPARAARSRSSSSSEPERVAQQVAAWMAED